MTLSTVKYVGRRAATAHFTLHELPLFPPTSVVEYPVCGVTPGSDSHGLWTVVVYYPKGKEFLSRSQQPTFRQSTTKCACMWAAAQSSLILIGIVNLKHAQTLKKNTWIGRSKCFPCTLQMPRDAGYGHGAWALRTRNDTAHQHGSSAESGEHARAPRDSAVV